jgi:hypothetical protein
MSSIISVALHFKREAGSYFTCKENTPHVPGLRSLACIAVETSISSTPTVRSNSGIKRTIWLFIVEVYPVRYLKQRIYFITGSFDFPNIVVVCLWKHMIKTGYGLSVITRTPRLFCACGTTLISRMIYAPDIRIVLYSKLFHISCITVIYSRYIINLIKTFHWHWHCPLRALFEE